MSLRAHQLLRHYGGVKALDGVSFEIAAGQCVALIGPNGAGKSTCFACLAGQQRSDAGQVFWHEREVSTLPPAQRQALGMARTFQVAQTFEALTALQNLQLVRARQQLSWWDRLAAREQLQALQALAQVGLAQQADATVADLEEALRLNPEQPQVLNYLGYSYVDRGENLDEALGMIERAVAREPGSGYIIDSLAWAYYRLGRYAEAVGPMEQASLLEPVDPIVTDHLGDIYWAVGRTREAEFQWHRALSYGPEEKDATRIRAKLEKGLDAVLADEGAKPLAPVEAKATP